MNVQLDRLASAQRGASASHTAPTPLPWELTHVWVLVHFEIILEGPERTPNGTGWMMMRLSLVSTTSPENDLKNNNRPHGDCAWKSVLCYENLYNLEKIQEEG